jgi:hypothetical protein
MKPADDSPKGKAKAEPHLHVTARPAEALHGSHISAHRGIAGHAKPVDEVCEITIEVEPIKPVPASAKSAKSPKGRAKP